MIEWRNIDAISAKKESHPNGYLDFDCCFWTYVLANKRKTQ
jgi:hypothetical protein